MKSRAYAKINLSLDIVRRREDGYHDLNSIMIPIDLWDYLEIEKSKENEYICNVRLPFNDSNTIVKAINYIKDKYDIKDNFKVVLDKRIPSQAGLGGGSSDGATAIRILNLMYHLNMNEEEIKQACMAVGADVLFTYYNKPAIVQSTGEELEFINLKDEKHILLVKPKQGVSTKEAYQSLNLDECNHPDIDELRRRLENGQNYDEIIKNSLEEPAFRLCPIIKTLENELIELGYPHPLMSGSGSTVFVISDDINKLEETKNILKKKYPFVYLTKLKKA